MELFRLVGKIAVDGVSANKEIGKVTANAKDGGNRIGNSFTQMAKTVSKAFSAIAFAKFTNQIINAADKIQSQQVAFANVFGDTQDYATMRMNRLAGDIGKLPGRLKPSFTNMSMAWMGMGKDASTAMDLVTKQTMMAADAAAFKGLSVEDASNKMAAWVKGNTSAGFALGLTAHQADIAAWASENLGVNFNELGNEQRKLIRMQFAEYFFENAGVLGFASENTRNLADAQGNLRYALTRVKAVMGAVPLEIKINLLEHMTNALMWLVNGLTDTENGWRGLQAIMGIVGGVLIKVSENADVLVKALIAMKVTKTLTPLFVGLKSAVKGYNVAIAAGKTKTVAFNFAMLKMKKAGGVAVKVAALGKALKVKSAAMLKSTKSTVAKTTATYAYVKASKGATVASKGLAVGGFGKLVGASKGLLGFMGPKGWLAAGAIVAGSAIANMLRPCQELAEEYQRLQESAQIVTKGTDLLIDTIDTTATAFGNTLKSVESLISGYGDAEVSVETLSMAYDAHRDRQDTLIEQNENIESQINKVNLERAILEERIANEYDLTGSLAVELKSLNNSYDELQDSLAENIAKQKENEVALDSKKQALIQSKLAVGDYASAVELLSESSQYAFGRMKDVYKSFQSVADNSTDKVILAQDNLVNKTDDQGEKIKGTYYSKEELVTKSLTSIADTLNHNAEVAEQWGANIAYIAGKRGDEFLAHMDRLGLNTPEKMHKMVHATDDELDMMEEAFKRNANAASKGMTNKLGEGYSDVIELTSGYVGQKLPSTLKSALNKADFPGLGSSVGEDFASGVTSSVEEAQSATKGLAERVKQTTTNMFGISSPSRVFKTYGGDLINGLAKGIDQTSQVAVQAINNMVDLINQNFNRGANQLTTAFDTMGYDISRTVDNLSRDASRNFTNMFNDLVRLTTSGSREVMRGFQSMERSIRTYVNRIPNTVRDAFRQMNNRIIDGMRTANNNVRKGSSDMNSTMRPLANDFNRHGQSAMDGLNRGLANGRAQVMNTARSIANDVAQTMRQALDINSPSRVMRDDVGKWIPYGVAEGVETHRGVLDKKLDDLVNIPHVGTQSRGFSSNGGQSELVNLFKEFTKMMQNGALGVYLDSEKVGGIMTPINDRNQGDLQRFASLEVMT